MSKECIRLSRIIALHWYGFCAVIEVNGLTLFCGETGTGKSALLDLIQFVMCPGATRFNRAAAGETRRGRDLRGYCLGDTNTRDNKGEKRYLRRSGVTIAALEFEWPTSVVGDTPRRETWGIRVEYKSPNADPDFTRFFVKARLEQEDFCDEGGMLLEDDAFKMRFKREYGGDASDAGFTSHPSFAEEMAVPDHLNFDPEKMRRTLPKAVAFEPNPDYQDFIRKFILESHDLDIASTKRSLTALRETERRVTLLREQCDILKRANEAHEKYQQARRSDAIFGHLPILLDQAENEQRIDDGQRDLEVFEEKHRENLQNMERAVSDKRKAQLIYDAARLTGGKRDEALDHLERLQTKQTETDQEVKQLRRHIKELRGFLTERAKTWTDWLRKAQAMQWPATIDSEFLFGFDRDDAATVSKAIEQSLDAFRSIQKETQERLQPIASDIKSLKTQCNALAKRLDQIDKGSPRPIPLREALQRAGIAAHSLDRTVEVMAKGERWWAVIETLLGDERQAVLLEEASDFDQAQVLWRQTPGAEPLLNPSEVPAALTAPENSLASLLQCSHPLAQRFLTERLGRFSAINDASEFVHHPEGAATPDGLINDPPVRRRVKPEDELCLGEEGLRRLRQKIEKELTRVSAELQAQEQRRTAIEAWAAEGEESRLDRDDRPGGGPVDAHELADAERILAARTEAVTAASRPDLEERLKRMQMQLAEISIQDQRIGDLKTPVTQYELHKKEKTDKLTALKQNRIDLAVKAATERAKVPLDVSDDELARQLAAIRTECAHGQDCRGIIFERRREVGEEAGRQLAARREERQRLQRSPHDWEYAEFDPLDEDNSRYADRFEKLDKFDLPENEQLAISKRMEWEQRLQDDVLDGLRQQLEEASRTMHDFRRLLDKPVGGYRYVLSQRQDPAYSATWKLLDAAPVGLDLGDRLAQFAVRSEIEEAKRELMEAIDNPENARSAAVLDYRNYHRYTLRMIPAGFDDQSEGAISLDDSAGNFSGGEAQAPFFVTMLAAFYQVYEFGKRVNRPSLGMVVMDEAFSKLSAGHIADCLELAKNFGLQLILAFPMDRLGTMIEHADSIVQCRIGKRLDARGIPLDIVNDVIGLQKEQISRRIFGDD